jgi:replicative DNA helicase Mcm
MSDYTREDLDSIVAFYQNYYKEDILQLVEQYPQEQSSLWVDFSDVFSHNPDLAEDLTEQAPETVQEMFEEALTLYDIPVDVSLEGATVRFHNLNDGETRKLADLRADDVDKLRSISGQISKASAVRPKVETAAWECQRCGTYTRMPIERELKEPHQCKGCERQGPFKLDFNESDVVNHQLIRIKQPPEEASQSAQMGNEIDAHIRGDLVGFPEAGDRADIPGVLNADYEDGDPTLDFYLNAWAVDKVGDDYRNLDIAKHRERIEQLTEDNNPFVLVADSIAPGITGGEEVEIETPWGETYDKYWWVRLACGVANLFGGWRRENPDGTHQRGDSHTAMIGDPSTGKSTIMDSITEISPRSTTESGKNTSGVGLTAAAVRDDFGDTQWSLEAGALVKSHNGVCGIDEIDKMDKDGLDRLHRALEKQRLEINKAGIKATLKCETSLLAAGNPQDSRFNAYESDQSQIDIVGSLMDRFDLVYVLKDRPDKDRDREIADSVISERVASGLAAREDIEMKRDSGAEPAVGIDTMRAWVALARQEYRPVIQSDEVKDRLKEYYVSIRQENANSDGDNDDEPVPATVRTLDGLLRLSEASARLRLSDTVEPIDVEMAITLVKISLQDIGYDPETGKMDVDYAEGRGSWSQKDRRNKIKGMIETLEGETGAAEEDILSMGEDIGMDASDIEHDLEHWKQKGEVYEPSTGEYRST